MSINYSCRHFRGDVPCQANKLRGKECDGCDEYDPIQERILIIKLGAPGDVLRTTALLPSIKRKWPNCEISWLTCRSAAPLLDNLPILDRLLILEQEGFLQLKGESFDYCLNLDNEPLASSLATQINATHLLGFGMNKLGRVEPANPEAQAWLDMAAFDRLKQSNQDTYQTHMRKIVGLDCDIDPIQINLREEEIHCSKRKMARWGFGHQSPIAFNTGSGPRWLTKRWPREHFMELGFLMAPYTPHGRILLLGGPHEEDTNLLLETERPDLFIHSGVMPMREFMAVVASCRMLVTADTLALHIALGFEIPTVGLFGPTSAPEIESTGPAIKLVSQRDCVCCYRKECDTKPTCMEDLSPETVMQAITDKGWFPKQEHN